MKKYRPTSLLTSCKIPIPTPPKLSIRRFDLFWCFPWNRIRLHNETNKHNPQKGNSLMTIS